MMFITMSACSDLSNKDSKQDIIDSNRRDDDSWLQVKRNARKLGKPTWSY